LLIVEEYEFYVFEDFRRATPIALAAESLEMVISLITLYVMVSGVRRI
jgi:hypothetical protein